MKCPYTILDAAQVTTNYYEYNENGDLTLNRCTLTEQRDLMDCLKEECAAWRDGRCTYRER